MCYYFSVINYAYHYNSLSEQCIYVLPASHFGNIILYIQSHNENIHLGLNTICRHVALSLHLYAEMNNFFG